MTLVSPASYFTLLANSEWSTALRESLYVYPAVETAHVVSLMIFVGSQWIIDLRLLGILFSDLSFSRLSRALRPWSLGGFGMVLITGFLLFYANPVRNFHSFWFRLKVILIFAAAANAAIFHFRAHRNADLHMKWAGALSLALWAGIIIMGRLIAQNWLDCDHSPPNWIYWFVQCSQIGT